MISSKSLFLFLYDCYQFIKVQQDTSFSYLSVIIFFISYMKYDVAILN